MAIPKKYASLALIRKQANYAPQSRSKRKEEIINSILRIQKPDAYGTGLLITKDGFFVTNHHVINSINYKLAQVFFVSTNGLSVGLNVKEVCIESEKDDFTLALLDMPEPLSKPEPTGFVFRRDEDIPNKTPVECFRLSPHPRNISSTQGCFNGVKTETDFNSIFSRHLMRKQNPKERKVFSTSCKAAPGYSGGPVVIEGVYQVIGLSCFIYEDTDNPFSLEKIEDALGFEAWGFGGELKKQINEFDKKIKRHFVVTSLDILRWINTFLQSVNE